MVFSFQQKTIWLIVFMALHVTLIQARVWFHCVHFFCPHTTIWLLVTPTQTWTFRGKIKISLHSMFFVISWHYWIILKFGPKYYSDRPHLYLLRLATTETLAATETRSNFQDLARLRLAPLRSGRSSSYWIRFVFLFDIRYINVTFWPFMPK